MLIDLHVQIGEKALSVKEAVTQAQSSGLDGILLVGDEGFPEVEGLATDELKVFSGARVTTDRGDYLLIFPRPQELPPLEEIFGERKNDELWNARDVLIRTRALGGATVSLHPYDSSSAHPAGDVLFTLRGISAIEVINPSRPENIAPPAAEATEYLEIPAIGGSEACKPDDIGKAATLFTRRVENNQALIEAIHRRECWPVEFGKPPF